MERRVRNSIVVLLMMSAGFVMGVTPSYADQPGAGSDGTRVTGVDDREAGVGTDDREAGIGITGTRVT